MNVSEYIAAYLHREGITHVFELSGGMIVQLLDSLHREGKVHIVSVHHEQAAAFAADAMGRMTGLPGIAMATSGPGATNLLTGIGSCYFDSSPAVFITGQVNRHEQKGNRRVRQLGFQETDIVSMARPITKAAWRIETPEQAPALLRDAFATAMKGRPGPVLLDVPMDVQRARLDQAGFLEMAPAEREACPEVDRVRDAVLSAERPMVLAGGGVSAARAVADFRRLTQYAAIPVVHSLMGVDVLPAGHPCRVGMIGTYGNRWANMALVRSDLLLVLGSRLDVRQTGSRTDAFKAGRTILHVDCDEGEMNNRVTGCEPIVAGLAGFIPQLAEAFRDDANGAIGRWQSWKQEIEALRLGSPDTAELEGCQGINPNHFMHQLSKRSHAAAAYVVDVGQHQMWAAQSLEINPDQRFLTSGGMGSMGFSLPAAIGASMAAKGKPVVVIAGDGGFQCNIQELQTVVRMDLPAKMVVINNRCHGMVRQFQESYFEGRYQSTYWGYSAPDFAAVARAYGISGATITTPLEVDRALDWLWEDPEQPRLLQVMVDTFSNAYPKVAFGRPVSEMEPQVKPTEMEST